MNAVSMVDPGGAAAGSRDVHRLRLAVTLGPAGEGAAARAAAGAGAGASAVAGTPGVPASLVRLGRTERFRAAVAVMAPALDASPDEFSGQLVAGLAALARALGRDLAEADARCSLSDVLEQVVVQRHLQLAAIGGR